MWALPFLVVLRCRYVRSKRLVGTHCLGQHLGLVLPDNGQLLSPPELSMALMFLPPSSRWSLLAKDKYEDADLLHQRVLTIFEKVFGQDHPEVAKCLDNQAMVLNKRVSIFSHAIESSPFSTICRL